MITDEMCQRSVMLDAFAECRARLDASVAALWRAQMLNGVLVLALLGGALVWIGGMLQ